MTDAGALPYPSFGFQLESKPCEAPAIRAGFTEVSGLHPAIEIAERRGGSEEQLRARKVPGLSKFGSVTLKRGVIDGPGFHAWIRSLAGDRSAAAKRDLTIQLLGEERGNVVIAWRLSGALPIRWIGSAHSAAHDATVAIEELVLSVESIAMVESGEPIEMPPTPG